MTEHLLNPADGNTIRDSRLDYHSARILILIASFNETYHQPLDGLTKLAKLDFLVRYPLFLQQLTETTSGQGLPDPIKPTDAERLGVESRMIRYKYGPWDDRYYPILGTLIGLGLVTPVSGKGRVTVNVTTQGADIARSLSEDAVWRPIAARCNFVVDLFNMTGNKLRELIYRELSLVGNTRHRRPI